MLSVRNLTKSYLARIAGAQPVHAIRDISFDVAQGEFFTLLGPSGCGKSTTLQCIAGLESPTSGTIEMQGRAVYCSDRRILVPANKRNLGMVFQSYAIWPHMTVFDNVAFPLVHGGRPVPAAQVRDKVMRALDLVKLAAFADRPSPHLSGGQQQRVALARALVHQPALLLLDEPLSNLDAKLRDQMRVEIRQLVKELGITTIFVTHDQLEAMSMSDEIVLMRDGDIVQRDAPREIYLYPKAAFAADFMGRSNLIPAKVAGGGLEAPFGLVPVAVPETLRAGDPAVLVVRPHALVVHLGGRPAAPGAVFPARVTARSFLGDVVEADLDVSGHIVRAALDPYLTVEEGAEVWVEFRSERCVATPPDTPGRRDRLTAGAAT